MAQGLATTLGHHFDWQAAVKIGRAFPVLELGFFTSNQGIDKGAVLVFIHRTIDIVLARSARPDLIIARLEPADIHIDTVKMHDGCYGVKKGEGIGAGLLLDRFGQSRSCQRTGRNDCLGPVSGRQACHFFTADGNEGMGFNRCGDCIGEPVPIHGQSTSGRHLMFVRAGNDDRIGNAHFLMQDTHGIGLGIIRSEGIGTYQFGQAVGLVCLGAAHRTHLMQNHRHAGIGSLPGSFCACHATADNMKYFL